MINQIKQYVATNLALQESLEENLQPEDFNHTQENTRNE